ncbi:MAG: peptidyl-prolyl cis-trans isomerase [Thermodesulfobacteriota bacterium]
MTACRLSLPPIVGVGFLSILLILAAAGCKGRDRNPGGVIARVGEKEIMRGTFEEMFHRLVPDSNSEIGERDLKNLKLDILNQIIEEELLLQEAERLRLRVSEDELSGEVAAIKGGYRDDIFETTIKGRYGSIERWKHEIRRKLVIRKVMDSVAEGIAHVSEKEALAYYREHSDEFNRPEQVKARMIVVSTEEEAQRVRQRLVKEPFADVAREVSIGPEGDSGGDLGFFGRGDMPKEFEDIVFSLPVKEISDVIKTPYGYHLFLVEARQKGNKLNFKEVQERIIAQLEEEKREEGLQEWIMGLKGRAVIEIEEELL